METMTPPNEYVTKDGTLINERITGLITDLPIFKASDRTGIHKIYHYDRFGFMLLPDIPSPSKIFNRNFINFWTKLLKSGPVENLFNQEFDVFTQERRQIRPLENPEYLNKHCPAEVLQNMKKINEYILSIIPSRTNPAQLYPSYLYSKAKGSPQVPHSDLLSFSDPKQEFLLLIGVQDTTSLIVFPRSHLVELDSNYRFCPLRISLSPGQILMFHPRLLHAGDKYTRSNLRIHYYVLNTLESLKNTTVQPNKQQL